MGFQAAAATSASVLPQGICCPRCRIRLNGLSCLACGRQYPLVGGIPCLIDPESSLFDPAGGDEQEFPSRWTGRLPSLSANPISEGNFMRLLDLARADSARPRVLVLGGARVGAGMKAFNRDATIEWLVSDVRPSGETNLLADAHRIPFEEAWFDAVIIQAVLEHVLDPWAVVAEIHRVLRPRGLVYAETPFMQQVHAGAQDFTRFSHLGHRRLFRNFTEIASGPCCGPGMALAWSWQAFLLSVFSPRLRPLVTAAARLSGFWLKYLDCWLIARPAAYDAASAFYFLGRRSESTLDDRDLASGYRGAQR
jgi:SAM-dependent methyltransferase